MGLRAARRSPSEPRLFAGPVVLRRTRKTVADLIGAVWLVLEIARLVRARLERSSPVSPSWHLAVSRPRREHLTPDGGN
jgi:hypothetical protein